MQKLSLLGVLALTLVSLISSAPQALAQQDGGGGGGGRGGRGGGGPGGPGGGFDPAAMRARMSERIREMLDIKGDDEWKVIEERVNKVNDARRNSSSGMGGRMMFGGPGGPGGRPGGNDQGGRGGNRGGFGADPMPEAEALQKAIEAKASSDEIKSKLAKYREARKARQAALAKAQDELRQVLSVRQEAAAVMLGLLD